MAYETKVILTSMAGYIRLKKSHTSDEKSLNELKDIYNYILEMANVEGIVLKPFDEE